MNDNAHKGRDIFQQIDVTSTTKNSITISWTLKKTNNTFRRMIVKGYAVKYHAVGSIIEQGVESIGPSMVTYIIKQLHENTIYKICVRALTSLSNFHKVETIHGTIESLDRRSIPEPRKIFGYSQVVHKNSKGIRQSESGNARNDNDSLPERPPTVSSISSTSSSPSLNLEISGVKNLGTEWYESCIVSSTASSSLSLALGSTLGAFLALGIIVFFVLIAKWQHKNRRKRLKRRWIASNISAAERSQRLTFNPELLQMDDLMSCDPCDAVNESWLTDDANVKGDQSRDNLTNDEARISAMELDGDLMFMDEHDHPDGIDLHARRSKEAIDALRRLLQDENIYADSFVISTPSIKDGYESYNLLVPLSSAQSLLPYLIDQEDGEFPIYSQNRHNYHQHKTTGNSRVAESMRKLKFKKHFTIDYSGCSNEILQGQNACTQLENALQQQVNFSFASKQSRLFKLQTLKTVDCDSSLDTDYDDCLDVASHESHVNGDDYAQAENKLCFTNDEKTDITQQQQQQDYSMQPVSAGNDDEDGDHNHGNLIRSFSVEW